MTPEDKIVAAINNAAERICWSIRAVGILLLLVISIKAAPLLSDGDEISSIGTVQVITPHPSWAAPTGDSAWISIAQTGWPLATWLPNGTVVSFSEAFSLDSMPSFATVTWAADDSASLWLNGALVAPEAPMAGNTYSVCSDFGPTCRSHTVTDILPWLTVGSNVIRFDVAQRGGWSFGLNYAVGLGWLDDPLSVPEPGAVWLVGGALFIAYVAVVVARVRQQNRHLAKVRKDYEKLFAALQRRYAEGQTRERR